MSGRRRHIPRMISDSGANRGGEARLVPYAMPAKRAGELAAAAPNALSELCYVPTL